MQKKVRYAVVGLGWIAQAAVLPAFRSAKKNTELGALVSDDTTKLRKLSKQYGGVETFTYDEFDTCLHSGIDAVYLALPNSLHRDFAVRAAKAGVHVLCEKPLEATEKHGADIVAACRRHDVKLMTAYRLHFEEANLEAIATIRKRKIGNPRLFHSVFTMSAESGNIRLRKDLGGGPLLDVGIYCLNAARYLFGEEPTEVTALAGSGKDPRFREVDESVSAVLRFSDGKLATFTCSFGAASRSFCEVVGTKGSLCLDPAFDFETKLERTLTVKGRTAKKTYSKRDQFAPELAYFSECVLKNKTPEPSGEEGLNDLRILLAIEKSARTGRAIKLTQLRKKTGPSLQQEKHFPAHSAPRLVKVEAPAAA